MSVHLEVDMQMHSLEAPHDRVVCGAHQEMRAWLVEIGTSIESLAKAPRMSSEWFRRASTGFAADFSAFFAFLPCREQRSVMSAHAKLEAPQHSRSDSYYIEPGVLSALHSVRQF